MCNISILDCTLRDGAYITNSLFGENIIKGIIHNLDRASVNMIEVGWLKNDNHIIGSSYYKYAEDIPRYLPSQRNNDTSYIAMIDYGRYDINNLSDYDGTSINTIRVVFPLEKFEEAINFSKQIKEKGYKLCLQAANTPSYSDLNLLKLCDCVNEVMPESISIVDTFGIMYESDLKHIFMLMNNNLDKKIKIGFHSHNNLQLSFALSIAFINLAKEVNRDVIIDSSLCGMGRGAGNTCTELITDYLNKKCNFNYDTNIIMDTIDIYMQSFLEKFKWGYDISLCIAGQLGSHVNNIAYLQKTHKASCRDIKITLEYLPKEKRKLYNYDDLEDAYIHYLNQEIDDKKTFKKLFESISGREVLFIIPGETSIKEQTKILSFINNKKPLVIGINSICNGYKYDYIFFSNLMRYNYAKEQYQQIINENKIILTSNIQTTSQQENIMLINTNTLMKTGWKYFNNSTILALRLFSKLKASTINFAGFDGYHIGKESNYSDVLLTTNISDEEKIAINKDIASMLEDFVLKDKFNSSLHFVTSSQFEEVLYGNKYVKKI